MTRTAILNKTQIIRCAYNIARDKGKSAITIREIRKRLGNSTAPIYTQYPSIEAIFTDLRAYIKDSLFKSTKQERTISPFLNIGVGILAFVLENKLIFNDFFLTAGETLFDFTEENHSYLEQMKQHPFISVLDDQQLKTILSDMSIYTYGLATIICTKSNENHQLSYYQKKLEQTGNKLISYHLYSSGKYETVINKMTEKFNNHVNIEEVLK